MAPPLLSDLRTETAEAGRRGTATRARLLGAAAEVITEGGYGSASVAAIATRAGMATGALYRHFPSKADLFVELFRLAGEHELDAMHAAARTGETSLEKLEAVLTEYASRSLANRRLTWALVYEPVDPLIDVERLTYRRKYTEQMAALIRDAIAAEEIPEQDPHLVAAALVGAIAEALVGPVSPIASTHASESEIISGIVRFCRWAVGWQAT
jgi:AcrR family transcriptional regulator